MVQWFDLGGEIKLDEHAPAAEALESLHGIQGLADKLGPLGVKAKDRAEVQVSAAEFVLEGLHAHKRIGRNEERLFTKGEKPAPPRRSEAREVEHDPEQPWRRGRGGFN